MTEFEQRSGLVPLRSALRRMRGIAISICGLFLSFATTVNAAVEPDFLMNSDPEFVAPDPLKKFNPALKTLWLEALSRPEIDMQRMAAETIGRATKFGVPGLDDSIPTLERILLADSSHPAARFAAAWALIELDSRNSAEKLLNISNQYGADLRQLVEPALAEWDFAPARSVWIARLDRKQSQLRDRFLALRGLGRVREPLAMPALLKIVSDPTEGNGVRLEAAAAVGQIADSGLEADAEKLSRDTRSSRVINRICSIRLLARHKTEPTQRLLAEFVKDTDPSVVAAALNCLNQIDPSLALPFADVAMENTDERVREQSALSYLMRPTLERIDPLCRALNDPHPSLRKRVCEGLLKLAGNPEFEERIRTRAVEILGADQWQGQEQATLLLASLNHQSAANRLVELLESPRPEVMVAAAWGLRKLAVRSTIPAIIDRATRQSVARLSAVMPGIDDQISHLFEACGVMRVIEAVPLMMRYVPYGPKEAERSRCAAIWALGWIHEGQSNPALADKLTSRIEDETSQPSESQLVKQMCVVALVRMKATDRAEMLRRHVANGVTPTALGLSMRWAMKELTGEDFPEPIPRIADQGSWFLEPLP